MDQNDSSQSQQIFTAEQFLDKLRHALARDGDFPSSARIVNDLKQLTSNPNTTANQITEVILKEPSLGIRVLHLVNSTFYRRAKPIMTVSQAVVQLGMRTLADLCAGLVLLQKFVPVARSSGPFASCLQKTLLASLISSGITTETQKIDPNIKSGESGYLAGSFAEIGTLLLAYYFPQIYENALKRSESKKQSIEQSIKEFVGLTPSQLSEEVIKALNLPEMYSQIISFADSSHTIPNTKNLPQQQNEIATLGKAVGAARNISSILVFSKDKSELDQVLVQLNKKMNFDPKILNKVLGELPQTFQTYCEQIDLHLPPLPEFVVNYAKSESQETKIIEIADEADFSKYVEEIRQAVQNGEPSASVITIVMETLAWGLKFDRVLLLLLGPGRKKLIGRMMLGNTCGIDPTKFERLIGAEAGSHAPDARAFREGHPVFNGDPILDDGWPIAACPIGFGHRAIGIIYADRVSSDSQELSASEQAAFGILAELLDRSVSLGVK